MGFDPNLLYIPKHTAVDSLIGSFLLSCYSSAPCSFLLGFNFFLPIFSVDPHIVGLQLLRRFWLHFCSAMSVTTATTYKAFQ